MFSCKMMRIFIFACLYKSLLADLVVHTSSGPVRGTSSHPEDVEAFLGIPYAEPPIGELRFARPNPKQWNHILDASSLPPPCPQMSLGPYYFLPDLTDMSEDCLYLNVWMPKSDPIQGLRPVIIFIHPGIFLTGSSNLKAHDGSNLASRGDAVVVTINYRLGSLGFFLSYTKEAEGNMGIYDQIMAMEWVKQNAKLFNGDPENIVLMGVNAGAQFISLHMVSPLTKNLFQKAILQSGSMLHPMVTDNNTKLFENSESLASKVGCSNNNTNLLSNPQSVIECLKKVPIRNIVEVEKHMLKTRYLTFFPRVNDEYLPNGANLIREGKFRKNVDVMTGIVKDEGTLFLPLVLDEYFGLYGKGTEINMDKKQATVISQAILMNLSVPNSDKIAMQYLNLAKNHTTSGYSNVISTAGSDNYISCPTVFFADFLSAKGNSVYFYKFEFRAASTPMAEWIGTTHLDEVQYVFGNPYHENFTTEETELSHRLIQRWSAFARSGNPNIPGHMPWLPYNHNNTLYLNIGQEEESIRMNPLKSRCEIWRKLFKAEMDNEQIQLLQNPEMAESTEN